MTVLLNIIINWFSIFLLNQFVTPRFGRRPAFLLSCFLQLFSGLIVCVSPYFWFYCIFRFLVAVATAGTMTTRWVRRHILKDSNPYISPNNLSLPQLRLAHGDRGAQEARSGGHFVPTTLQHRPRLPGRFRNSYIKFT